MHYVQLYTALSRAKEGSNPKHFKGNLKGSFTYYVNADRGRGVSPNDYYSITSGQEGNEKCIFKTVNNEI